MANYVLKPIYKKIFDHEFDRFSFDDRLEMQKIVYLLDDLGISVGEYSFTWYKHGPYSQVLQNDILCGSEIMPNIKFSTESEKIIMKLKEVLFSKDISYGICEWSECLGSLHYIKENILPSNASDELVLEELVIRKPHLNKETDNEIALQKLNYLFG